MSDEYRLTTPGTFDAGTSRDGRTPAPPATLPPDDALAQGAGGRSLTTGRPPDRYLPVRRWLVEQAEDLRGMRGDLREQLAASVTPSGGSEATADDVVLVTSEFATNALAHGRAPAHVQLLVDGREVLVVVSDGDAAHAPFVAAGREPGAGGFGLQIAQRLSTGVGWWTDSTGKHVWATFGVAPVA
ncbi:ATP-binding protein [Cellulomonas flavigena]|nr:ATP-binding protein [Cellulomonas flavigena]